MKSRIYYALLFILSSFFCVENVFADNYNVNVSANADNTTVVRGEEVSVKINIKSDKQVDMCSFEVSSSSDLEYVEMLNLNSWKSDGGVSGFTVENNIEEVEALTDGLDVLEIKYKVNGDGNITIKPLQCATVLDNESGYEDSDIASVTLNINTIEAQEDTSLKNITVTGGTLAPDFNSSKSDYIIELDTSKFSIVATANNDDFQDDIVVTDAKGRTLDPSSINFSDDTGSGEMKITITVNNKTSYNLLAHYVVKGLDNTLSSLSIDGKKIDLVDGVFVYEHTVSKDVTNFNLEATLSDSNNFKFSEDAPQPGNFTIEDTTHIELRIIPKDSSSGGTSVDYTIIVSKEKSNNRNPGSNNGGNSNSDKDGDQNTNTNPSTGNISMFIMIIILVSSLAGSIVLYQKNMESYK